MRDRIDLSPRSSACTDMDSVLVSIAMAFYPRIGNAPSTGVGHYWATALRSLGIAPFVALLHRVAGKLATSRLRWPGNVLQDRT